MSISAERINVSDFLSVTVLSNRATARSLVNEIMEMNKNKAKLDFVDVEFASRSFMDELNSKIREFSHIKFSKINMNNQISKMDSLVQDKKNRKSWIDRSENRDDADLIAM